MFSKDTEWALEGLCNDADVDYWFPPSPKEDGRKAHLYVKEARRICGECPVKSACEEHAVNHENYGIWAGLSAKQLKEERKRRGITVTPIRLDQRTYEGAATSGVGV